MDALITERPRFNKYPVRYQGMDMGMKGDQITEGLHKQDITEFVQNHAKSQRSLQRRIE